MCIKPSLVASAILGTLIGSGMARAFEVGQYRLAYTFSGVFLAFVAYLVATAHEQPTSRG